MGQLHPQNMFLGRLGTTWYNISAEHLANQQRFHQPIDRDPSVTHPSGHCHHAPSMALLDGDRMPVHAPGVGWPSQHLRSSSSGAPNPRRRCRRCSNRRRSPGPFLGRGLDGAGGLGVVNSGKLGGGKMVSLFFIVLYGLLG